MMNKSRPTVFTQHRNDSGFTIVELLVVIAIISVLLALILPAVQNARESARIIQCKNNFHQIVVANETFHSTHGRFPMGTFEATKTPDAGWSLSLLPLLDQSNLFNQFELEKGIVATTAGQKATGVRLPVYICPSDPDGGNLVGWSSIKYSNGSSFAEQASGTNVTAVSGTGLYRTLDLTTAFFTDCNGIFYERSKTSHKDIVDGSSNTLAFAEVTGGGAGTYTSKMWATDNVMPAWSINGPLTLPGGAKYGTLAAGNFAKIWVQAGFSSYHSAGCQVAYADGGVTRLNQNISSSVLQALATRASGEVVVPDR